MNECHSYSASIGPELAHSLCHWHKQQSYSELLKAETHARTSMCKTLGLLSCVNTQMLLEVIEISEHLTTYSAVLRLLPRV